MGGSKEGMKAGAGRPNRATSLVVGAAIAVVLAAAALFSLGATAGSSSGTHSFKILFPSADGMVNGSDVLEAGTRIGYISDIEPTTSNKALVTVVVNGDHWPLHQGLRADIRPKSLLGEKYVDLHDGPGSAPVYDTSATLTALSNADPVELDQFINSLDPPTRTAIRVLLDDLGGGIAGRGNDLNTAIATGRADLEHLAVFGKTLNDRDPDLDKILVGLDGVLAKITTDDQLNQWSQLITNGQNTLNDIESESAAFSRGFNDASAALADLNTAIGGAIPALRSTFDIAPNLIGNLQTESSMLAALGQQVTTSQNRSPNGECTSATLFDGQSPPEKEPDGDPDDITSITGLKQCSPLWALIAGLLGGPTNTTGAVESRGGGGPSSSIFRGCVLQQPNLFYVSGAPSGTYAFGCNTPADQQSLISQGGATGGESAMLAAFLRS